MDQRRLLASCSRHNQSDHAPNGEGCSTRTDTPTCWHRPTRPWWPTTRPAFAFWRSHIVRTACAGCGEDPEDVFYYPHGLANELVVQPAEPEGVDVEGILGGDASVVKKWRR